MNAKKEPVKISEDDSLRLLGSFMLSSDYYAKSREAE